MASPQIENGHTKIANELYEASFRVRIPIYDYIVWHCILRNTYGYREKEKWVSLSKIARMTGITISNVARSKRNLLQNNMITVKDCNVGIQKDYTKWRCKMVIPTDSIPTDSIPTDSIPTDNKVLSVETITTVCRDNKLLSVETDNKENKETYKENIKEKTGDSRIPFILKLISLKQGYQWANYPQESSGVKKCLKLGYTPEEICGCWEWLKEQEFWQEKPLSMQTVAKNIGEYRNSKNDTVKHNGHKKTDIIPRSHPHDQYTEKDSADLGLPI